MSTKSTITSEGALLSASPRKDQAKDEHQQAAAMDATEIASTKYPSVLVEGHLLHVCEMDGEWQVWLNTEDMDFTGLCVSVGATRQDAITDAVRVMEAVVENLQQPRAYAGL